MRGLRCPGSAQKEHLVRMCIALRESAGLDFLHFLQQNLMKRDRDEQQSVVELVKGELERLDSELSGLEKYQELKLWANGKELTEDEAKALLGVPGFWPRLEVALKSCKGNIWLFLRRDLHHYMGFRFLSELQRSQLRGLIAYQAFLAAEVASESMIYKLPFANYHHLQAAFNLCPPDIVLLRAIRDLTPTSLFRDYCNQMEVVISNHLWLRYHSSVQEKISLVTDCVPHSLFQEVIRVVESPEGLRLACKSVLSSREIDSRSRQSLWSETLDKAEKCVPQVDMSSILRSLTVRSVVCSGITDFKRFLDLCTPYALNQHLRALVLTQSQVSSDSIAMIKIMLNAGASPLQRDGGNSLLITNVRAALFFPGGRHEARVMSFQPGRQLELLEVLTTAGTNWTPKSHRLFPDGFRKTVFTLLCCNSRMKYSGDSIYLPRDPMGLVIANLAGMMYASEESQCVDTTLLLSKSYSNWSDRDLLKETQKHRLYDVWCKEKWKVDQRKRNYFKSISRDRLIELLVHIEMWE